MRTVLNIYRIFHVLGVMVRDVLTNISYILPEDNSSEAVIVFIPGNPGAIGFYDKFIEHFYRLYEMPIYGLSYAGKIHAVVLSAVVLSPIIMGILIKHQYYLIKFSVMA